MCLRARQGNIHFTFSSPLRPGLIQSTNHTEIHHATEPPPVVLFNQTAVPAEEYAGRLSVTEKRVTLHAVRMADEGSFTVLDREGKIRRRNCLNVRGQEIAGHRCIQSALIDHTCEM